MYRYFGYTTLEEISDEIGEEDLGTDYILKYEGWGGFCVEGTWESFEAAQKRRGIDITSEEGEKEREEACYKYAEEQSYEIIENEWKPELQKRDYRLIDGGYEYGGLYGRTWALFKKFGN